ncbi:hypothetical protein ACFFRR_005775 [Megaselia abdita]
MEISDYNSSCECKSFKCANDCKCSHKSESDKQLEIILNEMMIMSGMLPKQPNLEAEPEVINKNVDNEIILNADEHLDLTNSVWVPIVDNNFALEPQDFNEGISAFNSFVAQWKKDKPESPPPGAIYPCRLQFENIQDNRRQEEERRKKLQKQQDFDEGVRLMTIQMEQWEKDKPKVESPLRPPVYPCRFEREGILWDERKEREIQEKIKEQIKFDKKVAEVNLELKRLKPIIPTSKSPTKPPVPIPIGTVSRRQIREATEAKTREMFSNQNMRKYNTCWTKQFKPQIPQTPPNIQPQREIDTRGIEPPTKFSPLYSNLHEKMTAYFQNREYFDNVKRDRLKEMFRGAYRMR